MGIPSTSPETRFVVGLFYFVSRKVIYKNIEISAGIQLGTGCFGRVVKAEAIGMKDSRRGSSESAKTVAVKMALSENNVTALEALVSELKVLIYLGSHLNVLNLLGACTKQISKGNTQRFSYYLTRS